MKVREILIDYLKKYLNENRYDGLCFGDEPCGCGLDDFMPCGFYPCGGENFVDCEPAYKKTYSDCQKCEDFDNCDPRPNGVLYCVRKPE